MSDSEPPLNPRLIGDPGLGKTTLVCATARHIGRPLYIFQCTMDTRPEDLLITPVLTADKRIEYRASAVVSAMVKGGVLLLDEGNRMPERSWASLAPMLDGRRYVESALTALKIHAHPDFRMCVTMNDDTSTYELPGYIRSRLKPKIEIVAPPWEVQEKIVRLKCPGVDEDLLVAVFEELKRRARDNRHDSIRDMLSLAEYVQKLRTKGVAEPLEKAVQQVLGAPGSPSAGSGRRSMNPAVRVENLAAVPSYHYEPVFAREVRRVFEEFRPTAVALEMPAFLGGELEWAISCWPTPVASEASPFLYPFVPGDSMVEAFRLARERGIDVHLVDLAVADGDRAAPDTAARHRSSRRASVLCSWRLSTRCVSGGRPRPRRVTSAREAHMAERLAGLMRDYERVLWVGGAAHWPALRRRLTELGAAGAHAERHLRRTRPLSARGSPIAEPSSGCACRSALYHITDGRLPYLVSRYAQAPDRYEEAEALQSLALEAVAPESIPARDVEPGSRLRPQPGRQLGTERATVPVGAVHSPLQAVLGGRLRRAAGRDWPFRRRSRSRPAICRL